MEQITKKKKRVSYLIGIAVVSFIIYNTALFSLAGFSSHTATFWISYVFQLLTFVAIIVAISFLENKKLRMNDWLFRLPLIKHSVIYACVELVISILFMTFSRGIRTGIALAVQIVILGIYLIFALSCFVAKEMVTEVRENVAERNTYIKLLRLDAEMVMRTAGDNQVKKAFEKLAEKIRYSDPISSEKLADIEGELEYCIKVALDAAKRNDSDQCMMCYDKAVLLLAERNEKCKIFK